MAQCARWSIKLLTQPVDIMRGFVACLLAAMSLTACGDPNVRKAELMTSGPPGSVKTAGVGDMVIDMKITRPLPNIVGRADMWGRTMDAGRVMVRYVGNDPSGRASFVRQDVFINSNDSTLSRTPMVLPTTSTSTMRGQVGTVPVSAQETTTGYAVIPPTPAQSSSGALPPVTLYARPGGFIAVEGYTLTVHEIGDSAIRYSISQGG